MAKNKLRRFIDISTYPNFFEAPLEEAFRRDYRMKGRWGTGFFQNGSPVVLELGCGKGEYTSGLARKFVDKNFIGVDVKGSRMWVGATDALENQLRNVAYLRTRIEWISSCFGPGEVSEIWITFPDPQPRSPRISKRLTSARFLEQYRTFLCPKGVIHLKTDSTLLYEYTRDLIEYNGLEMLENTPNLYNDDIADDILGIQTFYERLFMAKGATIKYLKFRLDKDGPIMELPRVVRD